MKENLRSLKIMHFAMCIGALSILLIFHFLQSPINLSGFAEPIDFFGKISLTVAAICFVSAHLLFKNKTSKLMRAQLTKENFETYRVAYISKWAFLNTAVLTTMLCYFHVSPHPTIISVSIFLLIYLYLSKPYHIE